MLRIVEGKPQLAPCRTAKSRGGAEARRRGGAALRMRTGRRVFAFDNLPAFRHTSGMKVAVSIPDDIFEDAEILTRKLGTSRSEVYARALAAFVGDHVPDTVTQTMNQAVDAIGEVLGAVGGEGGGDFTRRAARRVLDRVEW